MTYLAILLPLTILSGYLYWRYVWFFRNPLRVPPPGESIVSPADGTVVYVSKVEPRQEVIMIKQGLPATLTDIVREDLAAPKILIGIFMSPFSVHYNRAPLSRQDQFYPASPRPREELLHGPDALAHLAETAALL